MAKTKYDQIYAELRTRIEQQEYGFQELLPSENTLVKEYGCSRNTVRRAIGRLADEGYVQSLHGKGVRIIYQPGQLSEFMLSGIESLKEAVARNQKGGVLCGADGGPADQRQDHLPGGGGDLLHPAGSIH